MRTSIATVDFVAGFVTCLACIGIFIGTVICLCNRESRRRTQPLPRGHVAISTAKQTTITLSQAAQRHSSTLDMMLNDSWVASESARWLNILGSRLFQYDATTGDIQRKIQAAIVDAINSNGKLPPGLGYIRVTNLDLGNAPPVIEDIDIRLVPVEQDDKTTQDTEGTVEGERNAPSSECETQITIGIAYNGGVTLGVETELVVDWPVESVIGLPISVNATVSEMSGKIRIRCPPIDQSRETLFGISFTEPPVIRLALKTEFGEHVKLVNPPKLEEMVNAYLEDSVCTAIVLPHEYKISLPRKQRSDVPGDTTTTTKKDAPRAVSTDSSPATSDIVVTRRR